MRSRPAKSTSWSHWSCPATGHPACGGPKGSDPGLSKAIHHKDSPTRFDASKSSPRWVSWSAHTLEHRLTWCREAKTDRFCSLTTPGRAGHFLADHLGGASRCLSAEQRAKANHWVITKNGRPVRRFTCIATSMASIDQPMAKGRHQRPQPGKKAVSFSSQAYSGCRCGNLRGETWLVVLCHTKIVASLSSFCFESQAVPLLMSTW